MYTTLAPRSIRLLKLLPAATETEPLKGKIIHHTLHQSDVPSYSYEALSYVWGSEDDLESISLHNAPLPITRNLYAALLRLRGHGFPRYLWIDSICIDQSSDEEKEHQIPLIPEIYAKAMRVIVWLGVVENDSEEALDTIREMAEVGQLAQIREVGEILEQNLKESKDDEEFIHDLKMIQTLLDRPYFQRMWVLQEMAAARSIILMCGTTELDGYVFCAGLDILKAVIPKPPQAVFLMRSAIFRPRNIPRGEDGQLGLSICSLGQLLDMYRTHNATIRHDKLYALLGMCSDDWKLAGLAPNYKLSWHELIERLIKYLLGPKVLIGTHTDNDMISLKGYGMALGLVEAVEHIKTGIGKQKIELRFIHDALVRESAHGFIDATANPIEKGDLLWVFEGSLKPMIVRLCGEHFQIIVVAQDFSDDVTTKSGVMPWSRFLEQTPSTHILRAVWNWSTDDPAKHDSFPEDHDISIDSNLYRDVRSWDTSFILKDLDRVHEAREFFSRATKGHGELLNEIATIEKDPDSSDQPTISSSLTPLAWAAINRDEDLASRLIEDGKVDLNAQDSHLYRSPLSWAASAGSTRIVDQLLATKSVDINSKDVHLRTPLSWAAGNNNIHVVTRLLKESTIDLNAGDHNGLTPLHWAAAAGHDYIVKQLLEHEHIASNRVDHQGRPALFLAARNGHSLALQQLLGWKGINAEHTDQLGRSVLSWAAAGGHEEDSEVASDSDHDNLPLYPVNSRESAVRLLLDDIRFDINKSDARLHTPLMLAAMSGYESVVSLLLEKKAEYNVHDKYGNNPRTLASIYGHERVDDMLKEVGAQSDADTVFEFDDLSKLCHACECGNAGAVYSLLTAGDVEVDCKMQTDPSHYRKMAVLRRAMHKRNKNYDDGDFLRKRSEKWETYRPIQLAAREGHADVVKLLLDSGKVNVRNLGNALFLAVLHGHEAVVKLLVRTKSIPLHETTVLGQTLLMVAVEAGHKAIVKLLLATGKIDVNQVDESWRTALSYAIDCRHDSIINLLLKQPDLIVDNVATVGAIWAESETYLETLTDGARNDEIDLASIACGMTLLSLVVSTGSEERVKLLLHAGIKERKAALHVDGEGRTALWLASSTGNAEIVKMILDIEQEQGQKLDNLSVCDHYGFSSLAIAAFYGHADVVKILLEAGLDATARHDNCDTPILLSTYAGHIAVVDVLLRAAIASDNLYEDLNKALALAAWQENEVMLLTFLKHGIDANYQNAHGDTALCIAARDGREAIVKILLEHGVDVNLRNNANETALSWARNYGNEGVVRLLMESGRVGVEEFMVEYVVEDEREDEEQSDVIEEKSTDVEICGANKAVNLVELVKHVEAIRAVYAVQEGEVVEGGDAAREQEAVKASS